MLQVTDPVLGTGNPTIAVFTLTAPGEDGRMLMVIRESLANVQPAVITLTGGLTFNLRNSTNGLATTATLRNPGHFVHLVYTQTASQWLVTSHNGATFA